MKFLLGAVAASCFALDIVYLILGLLRLAMVALLRHEQKSDTTATFLWPTRAPSASNSGTGDC